MTSFWPCTHMCVVVFTEQGQSGNQDRKEDGRMKGSPHFLSPADHQLRATGFLTFPVPALTGLFRDRNRDFQRNKIARRGRKEWPAGHTPLALPAPLMPSTLCLIPLWPAALCLVRVSPQGRFLWSLCPTLPARPRCNGVQTKGQAPSDPFPSPYSYPPPPAAQSQQA